LYGGPAAASSTRTRCRSSASTGSSRWRTRRGCMCRSRTRISRPRGRPPSSPNGCWVRRSAAHRAAARARRRTGRAARADGRGAREDHALPAGQLAFLPRDGVGELIERLEHELDAADEPHPAIELGIAWARRHPPTAENRWSTTATSALELRRPGERRPRYVLDWEFAHVGDPVEDVAWPLVRSWRFGAVDLRLRRVAQVDPTSRATTRSPVGTSRSRSCATGSCGQREMGDRERHAVAAPSLGTGAQRRARGARPTRRRGRVRAPRPSRAGGLNADRPDAAELAQAVREFLERRSCRPSRILGCASAPLSPRTVSAALTRSRERKCLRRSSGPDV